MNDVPVLLCSERAKWISAKDKVSEGKLILESRNTPPTRAQLTYRSHTCELYQSSYGQLISVVEWGYIQDAAKAIVIITRARAPLSDVKGEMRRYEDWS